MMFLMFFAGTEKQIAGGGPMESEKNRQSH